MKKLQLPLISVCLPVRNGEKYLQQALDSLSSQTYKNLELIVSDDDSNDISLKIIKEFEKNCDFPIQIFHHNPSSIGANWNNCLNQAKGKYIKLLFQDDLMYPECIERMVQASEADEKVNLVFCKRDLIIEEDANVSSKWINEFEDLQKKQSVFKNNTKIPGKYFLRSPDLLEEPINKIGEPATVLFRRSMIEKVGYFNTKLNQLLDIEYWYRILKFGRLVYINEKLAAFRLHQQQATSKNNDQEIADYDLFPEILYKDFFWLLNFQVQKKLLVKYNPVAKKLSQFV